MEVEVEAEAAYAVHHRNIYVNSKSGRRTSCVIVLLNSMYTKYVDLMNIISSSYDVCALCRVN